MTEKTIGNLALDDKGNAMDKTTASLADLRNIPASNDEIFNIPLKKAPVVEFTSNFKQEAQKKPAEQSYNQELTKENWEKTPDQLRWDETAKGRAFERVFSRGIFGAMAFAAGGEYAKRSNGMFGYHPDIKWGEINPTKPLQYIAKSVDFFVGKPIKFTAKLLTGDEERAQRWVHFRPTNNPNFNIGGRSLGHESVGLTFDFFCASVGDALFRNVLDAFVPHIKHSWRDEKGQIIPLKALEQTAKTLWRVVSYNGGEDWAVAIPYAYYVRSQRSIIKHFSPRFNYDSDRGLNGGSFKIDNTGKIIGNYNIEGLIDLQGRFTAYNIGTLMFREWYAKMDDWVHGKHTNMYGSNYDEDGNLKPQEKHTIAEDVGSGLKWAARSAIKGVITMTPAVPFFSIFRTPQTKYRGIFIDPSENGGVLGYLRTEGENSIHNKEDIMHAHEQKRSDLYFQKYQPDVTMRKFIKGKWEIGDTIKNHPLSNPNKIFDPYEKTFGTFDKGLNAIGKAQNFVRSNVNGPIAKFLNVKSKNVDDYVGAAFAYTPYMFAKRETSLLWDNGQMDTAAERLIDGVASGNWKEVKAGAGEIIHAIKKEPFDDPNREAEAQKRIKTDRSPAYGAKNRVADDSYVKSQGYDISFLQKQKNELPWQERIVQAPPKEAKKRDELRAQPVKMRSDKYSDAEMAAMLASLNPPSKSIH